VRRGAYAGRAVETHMSCDEQTLFRIAQYGDVRGDW
jgi:hypothetical protein